jgi:hypothetical protein
VLLEPLLVQAGGAGEAREGAGRNQMSRRRHRPRLPVQVIDHFLGPALKDEVMKIMPVQRMTKVGRRQPGRTGLVKGL